MSLVGFLRRTESLLAETGEPVFLRVIALLRSGALSCDATALGTAAELGLAGRATSSVKHLLDAARAAGYPPADAATALECVLPMRPPGQPDRASTLVYTAPSEIAVPGRRTHEVILDLVRSAQSDVVLLGYLVSVSAGGVIEELYRARQRGAQVLIVGNSADMLRNGVGQLWPHGDLRPALYCRPDVAHDLSAMHAKTLIVDSERMLVTSANVTGHGLGKNIELGLLVEGDACHHARLLVSRLIEAGVFAPCV